ncbi:SurA N-terminal domain-containing protein [Clostridium sp. Cult1]|uniref:SurA N-terminal domain-containing protein n=1 Tax=Clostridium sp. Cult1 TaxID=2079002 RepID=UPI001F30FCC2|nr:hypothetical protein [Clostridium sp. Cult1]
MFRLNKRFLILVVIVGLMSWFISGCENKGKEEGIVAKVDDEIITQKEFNEDFELAKKVRQQQFGEDILSQEVGDNKVYEDILREDLLGTLIIEKVINKDLDEMNIAVTDKEVEEALKDRYIAEMGGEEQYKEYLENNGITEEAFKRDLKRVLTFEKHREDFFNKVDLPEDEVKEYFDKNKDSFIKIRASHILVRTEEEGNKILEKLKKGEDFHNLVGMESADIDSAVQGGDLGYFTRDSLLEGYKSIGDVALKLKKGEISGLIKTEVGYHIILIEDRIDRYEDLKEDVILTLKYKKHNEKILDLKEKANIKIYMDKDRDSNKND